MEYKERFQKILNTNDPTEQLRLFATELNKKGLSKEEIYSIFHDYQIELVETNDIQNADILADVMDMFTGWYLGRNFDLH